MVLANATLITVVDVGYVIPTEPLFCLLSDTELCLYMACYQSLDFSQRLSKVKPLSPVTVKTGGLAKGYER